MWKTEQKNYIRVCALKLMENYMKCWHEAIDYQKKKKPMGQTNLLRILYYIKTNKKQKIKNKYIYTHPLR